MLPFKSGGGHVVLVGVARCRGQAESYRATTSAPTLTSRTGRG